MIPNSPSVFQLPFQSEKGTENTSQKQWCCILQRPPLHLHASEMSSCRKAADTDILPNPIPSSPLRRSNLSQVICKEPHLQISADTFVACAIPQMALCCERGFNRHVNRFTVFRDVLYHCLRIFDLAAKATSTSAVPTGSRKARQGHNPTPSGFHFLSERH